MTNSNQAPQKIERPSAFKNSDGFLNGMKWDSGNKSALFFFNQSTTVGTGENAKKEYSEFSVRFYARNAHFLAFLLEHKKKEEAAGNKYPLLINMDLKLKSWKRPTGKMVGQNNEIAETTNVHLF